MSTLALTRRALLDVGRLPGATVPAALAPTVLLLAIVGLFGRLAVLPGFGTDRYLTFLLPFALLQAAAMAGGTAGINLARDIEQGLVDRLLTAPAPRRSILVASVVSAAPRVLPAAALLLAVGFGLGAAFPGAGGLAVALAMCAGFALASASWACLIAVLTGTQEAGPLMQAPSIIAVLLTTAYAPMGLLAGWLRDVAHWNPVTPMLDAARQGFVADVTWGDTWPGLLAAGAITAVLFAAALAALSRRGR